MDIYHDDDSDTYQARTERYLRARGMYAMHADADAYADGIAWWLHVPDLDVNDSVPTTLGPPTFVPYS